MLRVPAPGWDELLWVVPGRAAGGGPAVEVSDRGS
jgi:hypothetical protein